MNPYETTTLLDQYLLFHYATPAEIAPHPSAPPGALDFPTRTVHLAPAEARTGTALDLGCAVGRSAFELSTTCTAVTGIDFSQSFIDAAETLRTTGSIPYTRHDEAHLTTPLVATPPATANPDRISFHTGDATALPPDLGPFDLVHAANLICRLPEPLALLRRLPGLVTPGGHLVITTPCTWLGEFTPPENWPNKPTLDWLTDHLSSHFTLQHSQDLPFLIRETARKFQCTTAQASLWKRTV